MLTKIKAFKSEAHWSNLVQTKGCAKFPSKYHVNVGVKIRKVTHPIGTSGRPLQKESQVGHTAVRHSAKGAGPCRAPVLPQIQTHARFLPSACSAPLPPPAAPAEELLSEPSFVLCLARSEALKIISCIS